MPKETFFKLHQEKQTRIFDAAVEEFARVSFQQASINRIIQAASIPRGSFYQYFEDKEDLYCYVLEQIGKEKIALFQQYQMPQEGFFQIASTTFEALFHWAQSRPLYNQIGMQLSREDEQWYHHVFHRQESSRGFLMDMLKKDQEKGLIRPDADLDLVMDTFMYMGQMILKTYYAQEGSQQLCRQKLESFWNMIYRGIGCDQEV